MQKLRVTTKGRTYRVITDWPMTRVSAVFAENGDSTINQNDWMNVIQVLSGGKAAESATIERIES